MKKEKDKKIEGPEQWKDLTAEDIQEIVNLEQEREDTRRGVMFGVITSVVLALLLAGIVLLLVLFGGRQIN